MGGRPSDAAMGWRFRGRIDESAGGDACWPYMGRRDEAGYGHLSWWRDGKTHAVRAHVVARNLEDGVHPLHRPKGAVIRHLCNNPSCCNPAHVEWGTQRENVEDARTAGTMIVGSRTHSAILVETDIVEIRRRHALGERQVDLAAEFGVSKVTLHEVIHRKTWKHVT